MLLNNMLPVNAISYLLLFLLTFCVVNPFPSTPLNQRNQDISWQAWLLVDDQNNNRVNSDVIPRKRITAKSVFIAPTFSPEDLPPCAEGYSSDPLGRCIKIIKLDEDKHLEFLVNKISDQFGNVDYEEDIEIEEMDVPSGPIQFSIPFSDKDGDYSNDSPQEETNFAIMFTPVENDKKKDDEIIKIDKREEFSNNDTNKQPNLNNQKNSTTIQSNEKKIETDSKKLLQTTEDQRYEMTESTSIVENTETSTVEEFATTMLNQEDELPVHKLGSSESVTNVENLKGETTSKDKFQMLVDDFLTVTEAETDDTTKLDEVTTFEGDESTTEPMQTTSIDELLMDSTNKPETIKIIIDTNEDITTDSVTEKIDTTTEVRISTESPSITEQLGVSSTTPKITTYHPRSTKVTTYHPQLHSGNDNQKYVRFPEPNQRETTLEPTIDFVRFPDTGNQQESLNHRTRDVSSQFGNFVHEFVPSETKQELSRSEENPFRFPGKQRMITNGRQYEYSMETSTLKPLNRRNREKHNNHLFGLSSDLMTKPPHRPSLPQEDLSYLFGYRRTNRQTKPSQTDSHRNR